MKKIFKFFISVIIIAVLFIIANLIWTNYLKPVEIPELSSISNEYGTTIQSEEITKVYEIYSQKIDSDEFINLDVNSYIDKLIEDFKNSNSKIESIAPKDKAVLKNVIDTYKVNDSIVSLRITTIVKEVYGEYFNTSIKTFNYNLEDKEKISLDKLFKYGYKDKISDIYSEDYLLLHNGIEFYKEKQNNTCTYNLLKEYASSKLLTAQNFSISQEEYDKLFVKVVDKSKKMVAITFDDGPHSTNTQKILEILDKYNARATFFMLGQNVVNNKDIVKDVYNRGNEIGIHTWDHKQLTKLSSEEIATQVEKTSNAIYDITGEKPRIVRPPYGAINDTVKTALNYPLILWNIDSLDWKSRDETKIVPLVMNNVQDGDIILLHDIHATTVPAVEKIVSQLNESGYQMVTVSELLDAKEYDTTKTKVFYSGRQ